MTTYKDAGVDIEKESEAIGRIANVLKETFKNQPGKVLADIGTFANLIDLGDKALAMSTDGVGTKVLVAEALKKYDTIGIDLVAMNVNDLICLGAEPLAMVDYLAVKEPKPEFLEEIGKGIAEGANQAGIAVIGGETATLPELVDPFDLAGTSIGIVDKDKIINGEKIQSGDVLIGLLSSGIHSNGLTLARKVLGEDSLNDLLIPTKIYVKPILNLLKEVEVKGLANMTGGGLLNLKRLNKNIGFEIDNWPEIPEIFEKIQKAGEVSDEEMFKTFNMGIGFCVVVSEADKEKTLQLLDGAVELGKAVEGNKINFKTKILIY